jgi:hypothetical protein
MGNLQRSCQACVKARRRCTLAHPRCARCTAKRIPCHYTNGGTTSGRPQHTEKTWSDSRVIQTRKLNGRYNEQALLLDAYHGRLDTRLQTFIRQVLANDSYDGSRPPLPNSSSVLSWIQEAGGGSGGALSKRHGNHGLEIFNPLHLEIVRVFDQATLRQLASILRSFPVQFAHHGSTAFVHSGLYDGSDDGDADFNSHLPMPLKLVRDICRSYQLGGGYLADRRFHTLRLTIRRLLRLARRSANTFAETLAYAQAIIVAQIIRLLDPYEAGTKEEAGTQEQEEKEEVEKEEDDIERDNEEMWALTHTLWQHAPTQLSPTLSPWKAWLFSENVRRTIVVCNILLGVYTHSRRGYTMHTLCVEALPFDARTGLWDAQTEAAWMAAAQRMPEPCLVTLSQFSRLKRPTGGSGGRGGGESTQFEDLLLFHCHS